MRNVLAALTYIARTILHLFGAVTILLVVLLALVAYRLVHTPSRAQRPLRPLAFSTRHTTVRHVETIEHPGLASSLHTLLHLVKLHYILPWFSRLSPSPDFPDSIDRVIRKTLLNAVLKGSQVDWPEVIVSRVIPLVKAHLAHFQRVQHLAGQLPLPLPKDAHPAFMNQAAGFIEVHLRDVVDRVVQAVLPEADQTLVVKTLAREVVLSVVLPVFDMLAEGDFWNQQIDEVGARYLRERKQVTQFLSRLSALPEPTTPVKRPVSSITHHSTSQQIDAFVRYIDRVKTIGEARRLRADIDRELRAAHQTVASAATEEAKRAAKYVKRLGRAKRHVDVRLATLGQAPKTTNPGAVDISLKTVMSDPSSVAYLLEYMERRGQSNLVQFWLTVETLKDPLEGEDAAASADDIAFISDTYRHLDLGLPERLARNITTADPAIVKQSLFAAQKLVFERIEGHWPDFRQSELYRKAAHDHTIPQMPIARHVSDPVKLVKSPTSLNRSVTELRLDHTPRHLDALIGPDEQPSNRLFEDEETETMDAIQAALEDTMDDATPPSPSASQSLSTSMVFPKKEATGDIVRDALFDDMAEDPIVQQAADGDLHLGIEIAQLDVKIQELIKQRAMLDGFVRRAELTGNDGELRLLNQSLSSIRLDLRALIFQKAQYEHQEKEGRLAPGRTTIQIPNAVVTDQDGKPVARYAVKITQRDNTVNTAWVVYRRYSEFFDLDRALRDAGIDMKRIDLPGKRLGPGTSSSLVESRRQGLERYLQALVYTSACDSAPLRDFLSRSSSFSPTRATLAPQTIVQSLYNSMAASLDESLIGPSMIDMFSTTLGRQFSEVADSLNEVVGMGGDLLGLRPGSPQKEAESTSFTAPICDLLIELLDLDESNWIKRQAIEVVLQQLLGSTIERKVRETARAASTPEAVVTYLDLLRQILFPEGQRRSPSVPRAETEKAETRHRASKRVTLLVPDMAANLIGRSSTRKAARKTFDVLQEKQLNQHLLLCILDHIVDAVI